jgi:predicted anti-sigma-YlaC factor YlaD
MMNCKEWEERVALHVGGDLPAANPAESAGVERHLAECAGCQALWSGMKESLQMLQGAHAEALTPGIYTAVRGRVMAEIASRSVWWRQAWAAGLAAAVVVMAVALAGWPGRRVETLPPVRVAAVIPPAPATQVLRAVQARSLPHKPRVVTKGQIGNPPPSQPLMVRLVTDDPDVVIYWIAD